MDVEMRIRSETFFARILTLPFFEMSFVFSPTEAFTLFPVRITSTVPPTAAAFDPMPSLKTAATVTARTSFSASALTVISSRAVILESMPTLAFTRLLSSKPAMFTPTPTALVAVREPAMTRLFTPLFASTVAFPSVSTMVAPSSISALVSFFAKSIENAPDSDAFALGPGVESVPATDSI